MQTLSCPNRPLCIKKLNENKLKRKLLKFIIGSCLVSYLFYLSIYLSPSVPLPTGGFTVSHERPWSNHHAKQHHISHMQREFFHHIFDSGSNGQIFPPNIAEPNADLPPSPCGLIPWCWRRLWATNLLKEREIGLPLHMTCMNGYLVGFEWMKLYSFFLGVIPPKI